MARCAANKRDGTPCTLPAKEPSGFCWAHAPENAEQRKEMASKAASSKKDVSIGIIKRRLKEVAEGVLDGSVERGKGSVAFQGYGVLIRALELERRIKETEELEERLEALERAQSQKGGRWGA